MGGPSNSAIKVGKGNHKESVGTVKTTFGIYTVRGNSLNECFFRSFMCNGLPNASLSTMSVCLNLGNMLWEVGWVRLC